MSRVFIALCLLAITSPVYADNCGIPPNWEEIEKQRAAQRLEAYKQINVPWDNQLQHTNNWLSTSSKIDKQLEAQWEQETKKIQTDELSRIKCQAAVDAKQINQKASEAAKNDSYHYAQPVYTTDCSRTLSGFYCTTR